MVVKYTSYWGFSKIPFFWHVSQTTFRCRPHGRGTGDSEPISSKPPKSWDGQIEQNSTVWGTEILYGGPTVLYYYDQMFTLCYTLHLLFTRQYVHDVKLHVTEQEKCSLRAEVHWLANRTAGWLSLLLGLCASEFRRNRKGPPRYLLMRLPSRGAPTPILYPRCQPICFESSCVSRFQQKLNQKIIFVS